MTKIILQIAWLFDVENSTGNEIQLTLYKQDYKYKTNI